MTITIDPKLEARICERADAEVLTVTAYIERLVSADREAEEEIEALLDRGLDSGEPVEVHAGYWDEKHRELDDRVGRVDDSKSTPNRFATAAKPGAVSVVLDPDVARVFKSSE